MLCERDVSSKLANTVSLRLTQFIPCALEFLNAFKNVVAMIFFTQAFLKLNFSISVFEFPELLKRMSSTGTVFYSLNTAKELAKSIPK